MSDRRRSTFRSLIRSRRPPAPAARSRRGSAASPSRATAKGTGRGSSTARCTSTASESRRPASLAETYAALHQQPDGMAWIGLYRPEQHEVASLAAEFELHELAVEDAIVAHQRPKLERYGDTLFVVLRPARYLDETEEVEFGEVHVFVGPDFVLTVRHSEAPDLGAGAPPAGEPARPAAARSRGGALRHPRPGRRRLLPRRRRRSGTTSTRSRSRCSAATRRCRAASTSCLARSPSSSARPGR